MFMEGSTGVSREQRYSCGGSRGIYAPQTAVDAHPQKMKLCPIHRAFLLYEWESMKANPHQFSFCFLSGHDISRTAKTSRKKLGIAGAEKLIHSPISKAL
jgi:hypothetical protein